MSDTALANVHPQARRKTLVMLYVKYQESETESDIEKEREKETS